MSPHDETEQFWQAFRYVGEEMTPGEVTDFETQLADNQAAREAVARAVELSQLVLAAAPERSQVEEFVSPALQTRTWMQPVGWIAIGAAACLAVVMAYQSFAPAIGTTQMASATPGSASDLALAWAVARADLPGVEEAVRPTADDDTSDRPADVLRHFKASGASDAIATSDEGPSADPMEEFTEPVAPAWLLVAVEDARLGASQEN